MCMIEFSTVIFAWPCALSDRPPGLWWIVTWRGVGCRYIMRLWQTVKREQLLNIKAHVPGIWANGCVLGDCVGIIWLWHDYNNYSWYIIIIPDVIILKINTNNCVLSELPWPKAKERDNNLLFSSHCSPRWCSVSSVLHAARIPTLRCLRLPRYNLWLNNQGLLIFTRKGIYDGKYDNFYWHCALIHKNEVTFACLCVHQKLVWINIMSQLKKFWIRTSIWVPMHGCAVNVLGRVGVLVHLFMKKQYAKCIIEW